MDNRYLVYKRWNGQIHVSIEYGKHTDGNDKNKAEEVLKRVELLDHNLTLDQTIKIYPYESEAVRQ